MGWMAVSPKVLMYAKESEKKANAAILFRKLLSPSRTFNLQLKFVGYHAHSLKAEISQE